MPSHRLQLLVVDDDCSVRALVKAVFVRQGCEVECAADGDYAVDLLRKRKFDAAVLDLMLPRTNGFEVIRELKSRDRSLLSRTIVLTSMSPNDLAHFEDRRFLRRVMRKPFELQDLVDEVLACGMASVSSGSAPFRSSEDPRDQARSFGYAGTETLTETVPHDQGQ